MDIKLYFTITASLLLKKSAEINRFPQLRFNILLSSQTEITPDLYMALASMPNAFIITLSDELFENDDDFSAVLTHLYLLIATGKSSCTANVVPVFSHTKTYQQSLLQADKINTYLNQQGIHDVELPVFFHAGPAAQTVQNYSLQKLESLSKNIADVIGNFQPCGSSTLIHFNEEIMDLVLLDNFRKQFTFNEKSGLDNGVKELDIEKEELAVEIMLWKKRTMLYQNFLSLSKEVQEKEYYDIIDWYNHEYEILPLWYKQLGHIIKVIMGKRSFRSLFSDNVKKYKD